MESDKIPVLVALLNWQLIQGWIKIQMTSFYKSAAGNSLSQETQTTQKCPIQMSQGIGKVFINVCRTLSHFQLTSFNFICNFKPLSLPAETTWQSWQKLGVVKFNFMDDNNPNTVTTEIWFKRISLIYSTSLFSRDFIPPELALLKFKDSTNMYRIEQRGQ